MKSYLTAWVVLKPKASDDIGDMVVPVALDTFLNKEPSISSLNRVIDSFYVDEAEAQARATELLGQSVFDALNIKGGSTKRAAPARMSSILRVAHKSWDDFVWVGFWETGTEALLASHIHEPKDFSFWRDAQPADDSEAVTGASDVKDWFCSTIPNFDPELGFPCVSTLIYRIAAGDEGEESWIEFSEKYPDGIATTMGAYFSVQDDAGSNGPLAHIDAKTLTLEHSISKAMRLGSALFEITSRGNGWIQDLASISMVREFARDIRDYRRQG